MRSMPSLTMSVGISTFRSLRVSLMSVSSAFMVESHQHTRQLAAVMVRKGGVEPPKPFGYRILSPARLPVPPLSRMIAPGAGSEYTSGSMRVDVGDQVFADGTAPARVAVDRTPR